MQRDNDDHDIHHDRDGDGYTHNVLRDNGDHINGDITNHANDDLLENARQIHLLRSSQSASASGL